MRLFLASAVLFLAFVAYAEAQDRSFEERFAEVHDYANSVGNALLEKIKAGADEINHSMVKAKGWMEKAWEDLQKSVRGQ